MSDVGFRISGDWIRNPKPETRNPKSDIRNPSYFQLVIEKRNRSRFGSV